MLGALKNTKNPQSMDKLYVFEGLMGQLLIAEAAPGNKVYNGGRWMVISVTFTDEGIAVHDPDGDGVVNFELTSEEQLLEHAMNLGHFIIGETPVDYFLCPLLLP